MIEFDKIESVFFKVLEDLKDYLDSLTLVGGWMPYVYARFLWDNLVVKPVTTADIDFGFGEGKAKVYTKTIFQTLSPLDYTERHPRMDRIYPVVLYKEGKIPVEFITFPEINKDVVEKLVGSEISVNKIDKFDFLLKYRISVDIRNKSKKRKYKIYCPKPSAFLYHKGATFIDREDEQKQAKDLHYMYFILRYATDIEAIFKEIAQYKKKGYFKNIKINLDRYFGKKSSKGCILVEKENEPDEYIEDLRQDIYDRFKKLRELL